MINRQSFAPLLLLGALPGAGFAQGEPSPRLQGIVIHQLGEPRWRSANDLLCPAYSPDGKMLAFAGNWRLGLWDADSGKPIDSFGVNGCGYFWSVAWAPDGKLYAAGQHWNVMRFDARKRKLAQEYAWHKHVIRKISLSADGARLASMDVDFKVALWEVPAGRVLRTIKLETSAAWPDIALSPDARWLAATGPQESPVLYEVASGKRQAIGDGTDRGVFKFAFTPDGKRLVIGGQGPILVWDLAEGKFVHRLTNINADHTEHLAISPDGKLLALVGWGQAVRVWDLHSGKLHRSLHTAGDRLFGVGFSPDSSVVVAGGVHLAIHRWRTDTGEMLDSGVGHQAGIEAVAWVGPRRVVTAGNDSTLRFWDANTGKLDRVVSLGDDVRPIHFLSGGGVLAAVAQGHLVLIDPASGRTIAGAKERIGWDALAVHPSRTRFAFRGEDKCLCVRSLSGPADTVSVLTPPRQVNALAFTPDGSLMAAGFEQKFEDRPLNLDARSPIPPRVSFHEPTVYLFDCASGRKVAEFGREFGSVVQLAFSADGKRLAIADDEHRVRVWDMKRRAVLPGVTGEGHSGASQLAFSPDGRRLLTLERSSGTGFDLWEVVTMTHIATCSQHVHQTVAAAFSPDGRQVVSGGGDTLAFTWDATGIAPRGELPKLDLPDAELQLLWDQLAILEAAKGHQALWRLVAAGDRAVAFLARQLRPTARRDAGKVKTWIDQLDAVEFDQRDEAMRALDVLGGGVEDDLRERLAKPIPLEMRRRIEQLLAQLGPTPERVRLGRALCVLEQIGTPAAAAQLTEVASGEPCDSFTEDARASLARLQKRAGI